VTEPIFDPSYWCRRLDHARELHHAVFRCPLPVWQRIEDHHRSILRDLVADGESVLDAGCGYGRLLSLMPSSWYGDYLGVDLSPDLVAQAQKTYPVRKFGVRDLRTLLPPGPDSMTFDWCVMISIRPMVRRNAGEAVWDDIFGRLRPWCERFLFLEYDEKDHGEVVQCRKS
jgi:SAM-dependent methyltransferase